MKRLKIIMLSILLALGGGLFCACTPQQQDIKVETIEIAGVGEDGLTLRLGESVDVDILITPEEAVNKNFEAFGYDHDIFTISVNVAEMKATISVTTSIQANNRNPNIGFKTLDGSDLQTILHTHIRDEEKTMLTPQNLQFDGEKFTWSAVEGASAYTMLLNGIPQIVSKDNIDDLTAYMELNVNDYEGHELTAQVKANGKSKNLDSEYSNEISFEIFNKPTNVKLNVQIDETTDTETDILSWDVVENVESYSININGFLLTTSAGSIDITDYLVVANDYNIYIKSNTNAQRTKFESSYADAIEITRLSAPTSVNMASGSIRWSNDGSAKKYDVSYNYSIDEVFYNEISTTKFTMFDLPFNIDPGTYTAKVRSVGDNKSTLRSSFSEELNFTKLESVKNIKVEGGKIKWSPVSYATNFVVYFQNLVGNNGQVKTEVISQTSSASQIEFNLSQYQSGEYKINVQPTGMNDKIPGNLLENDLVVKKLATPKKLQSIKNDGVDKIQWNSVAGAKNYVVYLSNSAETTFEVPAIEGNVVSYQFAEGIIQEGYNLISVSAVGEENATPAYINSDISNPITITKLVKPTLNFTNLKDGKLVWNKMGEAGGYNVVVTDINNTVLLDEIVTTTNIDFNSDGYRLEAGTYKAKVKALAKDNQNAYDGDFCDVIVIRKLSYSIDNKNLSVSSGTINDLENTEEYSFEYTITSKTNADLKLIRTTINDYVEDTIEQNTEFYVQTRAVPTNVKDNNDVYLVSSNLSSRLYVKKLPTIVDVKMIDGILYYGSNYASLTGYEFVLNIDGEDVSNSTNVTYNFNSSVPGEHQVKVKALGSGAEESVTGEEKPLNLNSRFSETYTFTKLETPENFRISSFANDCSEDLWTTISLLGAYNFSQSGAVAWDSVSGAKSYQLIFDDNNTITVDRTFATLQDSLIKGGETHTVEIRALGDGCNTISGEISTKVLTFVKFNSPNSLEIVSNNDGEKILKWSYKNGQDPNTNVSMFTLINSSASIAVYVLVDGNNRIYSTFTDVIDTDSAINAIKSNQCKFPSNLHGKTSLRVIAVPLNSYVSDMMEGKISTTNATLGVISDVSPEVYIESIITPKDLKMVDNVIQWSPLNYSQDTIDEYRLHFKYGEEGKTTNYISIKQGNPAQSSGKIIYVDSLANPEICKWEFNKQNFDSAFGEGSYSPQIYSICIQAIAKNNFYLEGENSDKKIYYIDSAKSTSITVEVLANPVVSLQKGVLTWEEVLNVENYRIYITKPSGLVEYIDTVDGKETTLTLQDEDLTLIKYPAGQYKFKVISVGNGKKTITSRIEDVEEKTYIKLQSISNLKVKNGFIRYDNHAIVDDVDNGCLYTLYIHSMYETEDETYDTTNNIFELDSRFAGGAEYYIRVMATGDSEMYISSNLTDYCYVDDSKTLPVKLATPSGVNIVEGKLVWNRVESASGYRLNISGGESIIDEEINQIATSYDFADIPSSVDAIVYRVEIKAMGGNLCLNSSPMVLDNVKKLGLINGFAIYNGYIVWQYANDSNYKLVIRQENEEDESLIINFDQGTTQAEIIDIDNQKYVQYRLLNYEAGIYDISIVNYGGSSAISSSETSVVRFIKLDAPSNLNIADEKFMFKQVDGATNYAIDIDVLIDIGSLENKTYRFITNSVEDFEVISVEGVNYMAIPFLTLEQFISAEIEKEIDYEYSVNKYTISVMAIGTKQNFNLKDDQSEMYYISSNDSEQLEITKPNMPVLNWCGEEDSRFYGKIYWEEIENADYYKVYIKAQGNENNSVIFGYTLNDVVTENVNIIDGYNCYIVKNKTYVNVIYPEETYSFIVVACKNKNGFDSDRAELNNLEFSIYKAGQDGSIEKPYTIENELGFNVIKYNLEANYKLIDNIKFTKVPNVLGTKDVPFTGNFDGNGYTISGLNDYLYVSADNTTFNGLFGYIGKNGVVRNFTFNANIYATTAKDNKVEIAMIAVENLGTIYNIVTNGYVGSEYNFDSYTIYNAGIAVYNYGLIDYCLCNATINPSNNSNDVYAGGIAVYNQNKDSVAKITKSGFTGGATGQFVGGIVAYNTATISECYYQASGDDKVILSQNKGRISNYAGGIAGYMNGGTINKCYVVGSINGATNSAQSVYVGGIVGYIKNATLSNSYVVGCKNNVAIVTATGIQSGTVKLGVVGGQIENSTDVYNVVCTKLDAQKVSSSGSVSGVEVAVQPTTNSLKNSIEQIPGYSSIYDMSYDYPRLKNAKY